MEYANMAFIFIGTILVILTGIISYIGFRLFPLFHFALPHLKSFCYWIPYFVLCYGFVFAAFFQRNIFLLRRAGTYWLAVIMYLFLFFILCELVRLGIFLFHRKSSIPNFGVYAASAALICCVLLIAYGSLHAKSITAVHYNITLRGQGNPLRIALVSDLHIGATNRKHLAKVVSEINKVQSDMVCIAGDIFDGNTRLVRDMSGIIDELKKINAQAYACPGNHDVDRMFRGGTTEIEKILKQADVILLEDEVIQARENVFIAGRKDARPINMEANRVSAQELLGKPDGTIIALDHQPTDYALIEQAGADLVLSGHTHAGQIFPANLMTRVIYKKAGAVHYGYWRGKTLQAVITSGAGFWGPPMRIGSNCEIAVIDVSFEQGE
jgi:predicted MPP superfamily phosphohydrolase